MDTANLLERMELFCRKAFIATISSINNRRKNLMRIRNKEYQKKSLNRSCTIYNKETTFQLKRRCLKNLTTELNIIIAN